MTSTPEQVIAKIREALEAACNNEDMICLISAFLLNRDQQTTQDERDEAERETSAFYIAQMVRRRAMIAIRDKVRPVLKEAEAERDALRKALEPFSDVSGEGDEDFPDDTPCSLKFGRTLDLTLTLGDFRRASTLLAGDNHE